MTSAQPQKEHQWLQRMVGEWATEAPHPERAGEISRGTESVRSVGGLWVIGEGEGTMPDGTPAYSQITLGYDPAKQRFVGTWLGSMMANLWVYEGTLDDSGSKLTLETEGPEFTTPGKLVMYRDVITILSDEHRTLTSYAQGDDGSWNQFMQMDYRRV